MPEIRSGRRTARPRASMPPRLCPTIWTRLPRLIAIDSMRVSSSAAAVSVQPTLAWMWER